MTMTTDKLELPIGDASFRNMRTSNCYYVDKTRHLWNLTKGGSRYWFLSRPRRFGKSLTVDTLHELFAGSEKLFRGLYIHDRWDWDVKHPVIRISFSANYDRPGNLESHIFKQMAAHETEYGINPLSEARTAAELLQHLIISLYRDTGQTVVILVDEYDKPILDVLEKRELAQANRDYLRGFYGIIKDCARYIRFVFVTGISMYSKVSLFSGLNNLNDISLLPHYATICGYTDAELDQVFEPELAALQPGEREEIQRWYNGYHWLGKEKVYNPFDILLYFQSRKFKPYWYETGTPAFLYHRMKEGSLNTLDLENLTIFDRDLSNFDIERIHLNALLFQCGYLTLVKEEMQGSRTFYTLDYPNHEVRLSLNGELLEVAGDLAEVSERGKALAGLLESNDFEGFERELKAFFAGIPYQITPPLRGSRRDKGASPQSLRWGEAEAVKSGASRPPTESAVAFGSASSTPPQGGSDSVCGSASSTLLQGGSDSVCGSASSTLLQGGSDVGIARFEGFYASILYACFFTLDFDVRVEESTRRGRSDMVLMRGNQVFVLELKVADGAEVEVKAEQALIQMRDKDYAGKYKTSDKRIHLLAVVFDRRERNLAMVRAEGI